jgi:signal peptidase I
MGRASRARGAHSPRGSRVGRALRLAFKLGRYTVALVVVGLALGYAAVFAFRLEPMTMLTGSMGKTIPPGSFVLTRPVAPATLRVGDVITFQKPIGATGLDTHRIVGIERSNGHTTYRTKGDANAQPDPWVIEFERGHVAHRVVGSVPHAGRLLLWADGPFLAFPLAGLIAAIVLSTMVKLIASGARSNDEREDAEHVRPLLEQA